MNYLKYFFHAFVKLMSLLAAIIIVQPAAFAQTGAPPNIIIIMTDDMGFSDLGCYGSEIKTPNLDTLAQEGLRFTHFYNTSRCCPTRASLLTGLYSHQAGIGDMLNDEGPGNPGYRGRLMERCVTIGEVLGQAGYRTIQTGKWHVGDQQQDWWPPGRGFDRFYGCPQGGGFYFRPSSFSKQRYVVRGTEILYNQQTDPPEGWYATDAWTDEGLEYIREAVEEEKPFLWYLAYNAPHYPLQAKPEDIARYRGQYMIGWDEIRRQRYEKLIDLGIIDPDWDLSSRESGIPAWSTLSEAEKDKQDLRMATYAAMIDCIDQNVGKIVTTLQQLEVYENTLILFLHDNGGCPEGGTLGKNSGDGVCGTAESFALYGACWANASDTPFRKYKKFIHEGGIASPLIAHWPNGIKAELDGTLVTEPAHTIDLMATCVDLAGTSYPETFEGNGIIPMEGVSLNPLFQGEPFTRDAPLFFEHEGNRGVRRGKWKLVAVDGKAWELYDMQADRTELNNLAAEHPEEVAELSALYDEWAVRAFVTTSPVNDAPVANDTSVITPVDTAATCTLNASDSENDPLTFTNSLPAHGTLSGTAPVFTYTPDEGFTGTDSFTFQCYDGEFYSAPATVTIRVTPPPVLSINPETFEDSSAGSNAPPAGWILVTAAGSPAYITVTGSDGTGGSSGLAGQVSSTDYINGDLPGAYLLNSRVFSMSNELTVTFDFMTVHEDVYDDATIVIGDIGNGLQDSSAGELLNMKLAENGSWLTSGRGKDNRLDSVTTVLVNAKWYRGTFRWTPTGGTTGDAVFTVNDFTSDLYTLETTGFTFDKADAQLGLGSINDTAVFDNVQINAPSEQTGYDLWSAGWNSDIGSATNDFDLDGINNLYEYALDGNPTNPAIHGTLPAFTKSGGRFIYIHPRRSDDTAPAYLVETTTNLLIEGWTTSGHTAFGTNVTGETLDFVSNEVDTIEDEKFIRLRIEQ